MQNLSGRCFRLGKFAHLFWVYFLFIFSLPSFSLASNDSPQTFTLDGRLFVSGTSTPLSDSSTKLTVQILNPDGSCLLYEETQTVNTVASEGYFNIQVGSATGSGKRSASDPGRTMSQIFQNISAITASNVPGQTCAGGAYTPTAGAIRYFRIIVTPSATNIADTLSPDIVMDSVPQAMIAQSVQGLERANILQVNNSGATVLTQNNLEALFTTPAYANLQSILAGNFMPIDSSGATLPSYAANPAGAANGDIWFDTVTNEIKYKNAAGVQIVGTSSGGISSLTVGSSMSINGSVAGTISSGSGTIDLTNTGVTAGTYTKMTVDAKGRVTAGTISLVEADIPNLTVAGKVSGNTITSGTISGSAGINTSGNLISTGTVSGLTVQATNVRVYNGANYIQLAAPALGGNVNLTLPTTDGNANEFLKTDGAGILSWATSTVTSTDVTTALGYTPLNVAATFSGDVSGTYNAISVDKIKGRAITAGSVSGQMMIYDGSAWVNNIMSGDATLAHNGILTLNKVPVTKGGTNATTFGNNRIIASNGTGSALQDFTCSLNQVISFDASGNAVCANVSALSGAILNGGNTTGADISIGTNDNKAFNFKVNNTIAMTISQSGVIGIGTADPISNANTKLHIEGSGNSVIMTPSDATPTDGVATYMLNSGNGSLFGIESSTGGWLIAGSAPYATVFGNQSNASFQIGTNNAIRMTVTATGNVGIGISNPTTALDISGAINQIGIAAPAVSPASEGRIYYDRTANKFKVSQNGAAYVDLVSAGGGGGLTSLGGQTGATQTLAISVDNSVATPTITSATDAHTWKIPMASNAGTTAGLLNKTDYDLFSAKLGTTTTFAGDVSGAYSSTIVQKIQGKAVTAASVSGQTMIYNGTAWVNSVVSGDATLAYDGMLTLNKVPVSKGGTNATSFSNNRIIASNGTGTALQDFSCSLNQVITFDASGNAACANVSSLSAAILNGGNTTGADISIGTNDNKALNFKTNNSTAMTISQNGFVGIGTLAPASKFEVQSAQTDTSGDKFGADLQITANPASASTAQFYGVGGVAQSATGNSNNIHRLSGVYGEGFHQGTGTVTHLEGGRFETSSSTTTPVTNVRGIYASAYREGAASSIVGGEFWATKDYTGAATNVYGVKTTSQRSSGTIGDLYGFHATVDGANVANTTRAYGARLQVSGAATSYGIYLDDVDGTNQYGVYQVGADDVNYLAGKVGIGTATPSANAKLEVVGAAASRANIITSGNAVDLSLSNVHVLKSVGSSTINLSNMTSGGSYTLVISDTTQTTYTFSGCTNTYFSPANSQTYQRSTFSILTVIDTGVTDCYINWVTGFN